jgi:hypothetical protein
LVKRVIEEGWSVKEAAEAQGLRECAASLWLGRFRDERIEGVEAPGFVEYARAAGQRPDQFT